MTNSIEIEIKECFADYLTTTSNHRGADLDQAIEKAIAKRYGKAAVFVEDRGIREAYPRVRFGQVFKRTKGERTLTKVTGRICITVR